MNNLLDDILNDAISGASVSVVAQFDQSELEGEDLNLPDREIPILPLRNMMLFPSTLLPVTVNRASARKLLNEAQRDKRLIAVFGQKDEENEMPTSGEDLNRIGVTGRVVKMMELPDGSHTAFLQGIHRVHLLEAHMDENYMMGHVESYPEEMPAAGDRQFKATIEACKELADKFLQRSDGVRFDTSFSMKKMTSRVFFINFLCASLPVSNKEHLMLLEANNLADRATKLLELLNREVQFAQLKANIQMQTHADLSRQQREYFLKKEMENIKDELGENSDDDIKRLRERAAKKHWSQEVGEHFERELEKLSRQSMQSPEYSTQYEYLDTLLQLPWNEYTKDCLNINTAQRVLDKDHFGMEKVKERILEHLAVLKMRGDLKSPIICLYGPPGVGKTSLGKSIARAMKRKYVRVSLGGVHDESEIRGHRRTYVGAMPGRIIKGLLDAGSANPVFVLDEIDKVGADAVHGDPSSALLEVLDPEQNKNFHDNYVDMDFDVSNVMFIATANNIATIPAPLLDRMELIEVSGYLTEEKIEIARRHLVKKQIENIGLQKNDIQFAKAALEQIIENYTRESGVRELDKQISKIMRKVALERARNMEEGAFQPLHIKEGDITQYLGTQRFSRDKYQNNDYAGVVTGLAWTAVGGEILFIETSLSRGKGGKLTLTGNLGDVMKESAMLALEYLKAHCDHLNVAPEVFDNWNVHIHVPEGAVPKDGPSAGVTIATSLASALTQRKVRKNLAMTGEITLRGKVLPVGGIKEKILAAKRAGITDIMLCHENEKNIKDIPELYVKGLTFHYVENVEDVLAFALLDEKVKNPVDLSVKTDEEKNDIQRRT